MQRLVTAAVLAPTLWALITKAPPTLFYAVALALISIACWECYRMLERRGGRPFTWLGTAASLAVVWSFLDIGPRFAPHLPLLGVTLVVVVLSLWLRSDPAEMLDSWMTTLLPTLMLGLSLAHLVGLRAMPGEDGPDLLLLLFICVIFADSSAFYAGTLLGRHRMAPRLSPKKSWEGAAGGLAGSVIGALVAHFWFYQRLPLGDAIVIGVVLGVAAILGDLAESVLKRAAGVKDSSSLLPGHGGLLDRTDSLLLTGPILYHYYRLLL